MPDTLYDIITRQIELNGPVSVAAYMDLCLAHPQHGYYASRDPLGKAGDFTTAPEISQLFGEMVGIWIADMWQKLSCPSRLILCELGPGRGTLMADIVRVAEKLPELKSALEIHLVEMNKVLIDEQQKKVTATWHHALEAVPDDAPIIVIGNEFLDALPFRQLVKTRTGWNERVIGLQDGKLAFGIGGAVAGINLPDAETGAIYEFSPVREAVWRNICDRVTTQNGAALMIDYGYDRPQSINTFQAVKDHRYADVLERPGDQDLTSHVDFHKLQVIEPRSVITTQADFLTRMGIDIRAEKLAALNQDKHDNIYSGLKRLTHRDQMGQLFKVIEYCFF